MFHKFFLVTFLALSVNSSLSHAVDPGMINSLVKGNTLNCQIMREKSEAGRLFFSFDKETKKFQVLYRGFFDGLIQSRVIIHDESHGSPFNGNIIRIANNANAYIEIDLVKQPKNLKSNFMVESRPFLPVEFHSEEANYRASVCRMTE